MVRVDLADAAGTTLAEPIDTAQPLPAFDTAAMDGFAVSGPGPWRIRGQVRPGAVWTGALQPGDAVEISTGALVPAEVDAVLPVEYAHVDGTTVSGPLPSSRTHIRRLGEDAPAGQRLAPAGLRVGAVLLGLAATCGRTKLLVTPRPRVAVLVTGDELTQRGPSGAGLVRDALGPMMAALVDGLGGDLVSMRHVPDQPAGALSAALQQPGSDDAHADVVAVTGSTSVGRTDQLRQLLHDGGARWLVDTVACRPGHPQIMARLVDGRWLVGLPGNPFAALVAAYTLLGPLVAGLSGQRLPALPRAVVDGDIRPAPGLTRLLPVSWDGIDARVLSGSGAAFLQGAALADALAAIPPDWEPDLPVPLVPTR